MSLEDVLETLDEAEELNNLLRAAMINGPGTPEWDALAPYFADKPRTLTRLPRCRERVIQYGDWRGSTLGPLLTTVLKRPPHDDGHEDSPQKPAGKAAAKGGRKASGKKAARR